MSLGPLHPRNSSLDEQRRPSRPGFHAEGHRLRQRGRFTYGQDGRRRANADVSVVAGAITPRRGQAEAIARIHGLTRPGSTACEMDGRAAAGVGLIVAVSGRGATIHFVNERLSDRLRLKAGVDPAASAARLKALIDSGGNVTSVAGGPSAVPRIRDEYLRWTEAVETCLTDLTHDREPIADLYTAHYWRIRVLETDWRTISDPRPFPLFYSETARQLSRLRRLLEDLNERRDRLALAGGRITVLDTNVLMHYQPIDQIPWPKVVDGPTIRLVIPLRVIEELDAKKYAKNADLARRARKLLPALEQLLGAGGRPGQVADNVTVEVPVDTGPRERPEDADEEIIAICRDLTQFSGRDVTLVTGDTAMRIRAQAHGLITVTLGDQHLRVQLSTTPEDSAAKEP